MHGGNDSSHGRSGAAGVDFLEHRHGSSGRGGRRRTGAEETAAQEQLFVFFVELENLQNAGAGVFELSPGFGIPGRRGGEGAESGERLVELLEQGAFAREKIRAGGPLVLAEESVLFQRTLVDGVAKTVVGLERFGLGHGVEAVLAPAGRGLAGAGLGASADVAVGLCTSVGTAAGW